MTEIRQLRAHRIAYKTQAFLHNSHKIPMAPVAMACIILGVLFAGRLLGQHTNTAVEELYLFMGGLIVVFVVGLSTLGSWIEKILSETLGCTPSCHQWEEAWPDKAERLRLLTIEKTLRKNTHTQMSQPTRKV